MSSIGDSVSIYIITSEEIYANIMPVKKALSQLILIIPRKILIAKHIPIAFAISIIIGAFKSIKLNVLKTMATI